MRLTAIVMTWLLLFSTPEPGEALSLCRCQIDLVQAAHEGRPVFSGTVTRVEFLDELKDDASEPRILVDIDVNRFWGGEVSSQITLHTYYNRAGCEGYWFKEGGTYLLFAYVNGEPEPRREHAEWPPPGTLGTLYCGVHELEGAAAQVERLNRAFPGQSGSRGPLRILQP